MKKTRVERKHMRERGVLRTRFERAGEVRAPARAEAMRRIASKPSFFESLSPEALEAIRNFDWPEILGPPRYRED